MILSKDNIQGFFLKMMSGSFFEYSAKDFLWEDIESIAIDQGKKVKQIFDKENLNYCAGLVIYDIKTEASSIRDEENLRLKKEINKCYQRIEDLEIQTGLRDNDRYERCEYCKKNLYPYQSKTTNYLGSTVHTECELSNKINELEQIISKKEELVNHWTSEAKKIGYENHALIVENRTIIEENKSYVIKIKEMEDLTKSLEDYKRKIELSLLETKEKYRIIFHDKNISDSMNKEYFKLLIKTYEILKRVKRLLGTGEGIEFCAIPSVNLPGEIREILKGWCFPVYSDVKELIEDINESELNNGV